MSAVPYTFANDTGNIALSQLDVNFANVKAQADTATVVLAHSQPNITSVGTLSSLSVAGNIATSGYVLGNGSALTGIVVSGANAAQLIGTTLSSNVANSSLTSVGTLNGLAVAGTISTNGTVIAAYFNGDGSGLSAINGANVVGNLAANVTSVGTLTSLSVSGNTVSGNLLTGGLISATGNITGGNILTNGAVSATGNITTAGYFVGTFQGNISGNLTVPGSNTQVLFNDNGNAGASSGFVYTSSNNSVSVIGNVTAGNFGTSGSVSASGNVVGNYFVGNGAALTSITGTNVTGTVANATYAVSAATAITAGTVTTNAQPNITSVGTLTSVGVSGNILTNGLISAAGNVTGAYIVGNGSRLSSLAGANVSGTVANATYATSAGSVANATFATSAGTVTTNAQPNITSVGSLTTLTVGGNISTASAISATGNITGGNIRTGGLISATGNIAGNYFNGSQLTGLGGPAFIATQTVYQSIPYAPTGGAFFLIYNSVSKNIGSGYNSSTGVFTAPVAGFYQVSASIGVNPFANTYATGGGALILVRNAPSINAIIASPLTYTVAAGPFVTLLVINNTYATSASAVSCLIYLNANDYIQPILSGICTDNANNWTTQTNLVPSSFEAVWVRGA